LAQKLKQWSKQVSNLLDSLNDRFQRIIRQGRKHIKAAPPSEAVQPSPRLVQLATTLDNAEFFGALMDELSDLANIAHAQIGPSHAKNSPTLSAYLGGLEDGIREVRKRLTYIARQDGG